MALVFACSSEEIERPLENHPRSTLKLLLSLATEDRHGVHRLVDDPESADLILFAEAHSDDAPSGPYFHRVRRHPVFRRFRRKCAVISGMDRIVPLVPGIFASIEGDGKWNPIARSGPYLVAPNPFLRYEPLRDEGGGPQWLASFVGASNTVPARRALREIRDPRFFVRDTHAAFVDAAHNNRTEELNAFKRLFVDMSLDSRFVLCPRGHGASSIRIFEAMQMGRAPVILSDTWVEPDGVDWASLSLRVAEQDIPRLPEILAGRATDANELGERALAAWEANFSQVSLFHYFAERGLDLVRVDPVSRGATRAIAWMQMLQPYHLRVNWRLFKRRLREARHR